MFVRRSILLIPGLLLGLVFVTVAFAQADQAGKAGGVEAPATAAGASIDVGHNSLVPATVQIGVGQSVTFRCVAQMSGGHTIVARDGSFTSPPLAKDQSWSHSFDVPGVYKIGIKEHPAAEATIEVK